MKKLTYEECLLRARRDFKDLVIYFCVTRAKHNKDFFDNGTFSSKKMMGMFKLVESWKSRSASEKKMCAKQYADVSKTLNYAFGIDHQLVKQVLGRYLDANGKKVCIKIDDILNLINKDKEVIKEVNAGKKFEFEGGKHKKDDKGKSIVKCYWSKKYLIANRDYWFMLLNDEKYSDVRKFASSRLQKIVFDWFNGKFQVESKTADDKAKQADEHKQIEKQAFAEEIKPLEKNEFGILFARHAMSINDFKILIRGVYGIKMLDGMSVEDRMLGYKLPDISPDKKATDEEIAMMWKRLYLGNCKQPNNFNNAVKEFIEEHYKKANRILTID